MLQAPPDRLTRLLVLGENILALARETGEPITVLLDWLNSPPIAATLAQFRAAQDRARTEAALRTLERIHTESPDLTERRRAATTILRITRPAPAARPRQSAPRNPDATRRLDAQSPTALCADASGLDGPCLDAFPANPTPPPATQRPAPSAVRSSTPAPTFTPDAAFELTHLPRPSAAAPSRDPQKNSSLGPQPSPSPAPSRSNPRAFDPALAVMFPIPAFIPAPDVHMTLAPTLDQALSDSRLDSSLIALINSS